MKTGRVDDIERYWAKPPKVCSLRCWEWVERIKAGFSPNSRISSMGYGEASAFYGVYIWEYIHILRPTMKKHCGFYSAEARALGLHMESTPWRGPRSWWSNEAAERLHLEYVKEAQTTEDSRFMALLKETIRTLKDVGKK